MATYEDVHPNDDSFDDIFGDFYVSLVGAVEQGDMETLKVIKANERDSFSYFLRTMGGRLLYRAIIHCQLEVADFLLCNGCATDQYPRMRTSPLHLAAQSFLCSSFCNRLIQYDADVNKRDLGNNTPLHLACRANLEGTVKTFLLNGADSNIMNNNSETPLHIAAYMGHVGCVKLLLELGAPYTDRLSGGIDSQTSLDSAVRSLFTLLGDEGVTRSIHAFLKWSTPDTIFTKLKNVNVESSEIIQLAICHPTVQQKLQTIDLLIQHGAKFDIVILTLKHVPPDRALCAMKSLFENHSLNVNSCDSNHFTPLHYAVHRLSIESVKYLIDRGANVNSLGVDEVSPLELALRQPFKEEVVKLLVENGANVNYTTANGWSPLIAALQTGHVPLMQFILNSGADPNLTDRSGYTAIMHQLSRTPCQATMIDWLIRHGADVQVRDATVLKSSPLHMAARFESNEGTEGASVMRMILKQVENVDIQDAEGYTPLMRAIGVKYHYTPIINLLLNAGANPHLRGLDGKTAMHLAIVSSKTGVVSQLLDHEKNFDFENVFSDRCALFSAIYMNLPYNRDELFFVKRFHYRTDLVKAREQVVNDVLLNDADSISRGLCEWLRSSSVERSCLHHFSSGPAVLLQEAESYVLKKSSTKRLDESQVRGVLEYRLKVNEVNDSYVDACDRERTSMKNDVVCNNFTVHDILTATVDELTGHMKRVEVYQALSINAKLTLSDDTHYPIYGHVLREQVRAALAKLDLLSTATYFLNDIFSRRQRINDIEPARNIHLSFTTLPAHVIDNIVGHLSTEDLLNFFVSHFEPATVATLKQRWRQKLTMLLKSSKS